MARTRKSLNQSREEYDALHAGDGFYIGDGSYEAVAALTAGLKVVDVGCGEGWLEALNPDIVGVDFSAVALEQARLNGARHLIQASADSLPFADGAFDLAVSLGCLEHFPDQEAALSEMARVSRLQLLTIHEHIPVLGHLRKPLLALRGHGDQPIEMPVTRRWLRRAMARAGLTPIFIGTWRYIDLRYVWDKIPYGAVRLPSHIFVLSMTGAPAAGTVRVT